LTKIHCYDSLSKNSLNLISFSVKKKFIICDRIIPSEGRSVRLRSFLESGVLLEWSSKRY
jgi:hypothetical protein